MFAILDNAIDLDRTFQIYRTSQDAVELDKTFHMNHKVLNMI